MTEAKQKMLIVNFFLIHSFLAKVLNSPSIVNSDKYQEGSRELRYNIRVVGSFLYYLFMEEFEEIPTIPGNLNRLEGDLKPELHKGLYYFGIYILTFRYKG